jgi:hypothetical protein
MAHCAGISIISISMNEGASVRHSFQNQNNTYPCSSEPCRGEDIDANVTVDYEKLGVNGTIHTYFPYVRRR